MTPFKLLEPGSLPEACSLLSRHGDKAKVIAGGQSLLLLLKHRAATPQYLINLKGLPGLEYIRPDRSSLYLGALTTHRAIETSPLIEKHFPVLAEMEGMVASVPIRNWGTIGGNLCHADPGGDPAPVLMALNSKLKVVSKRGERHIALNEFFKGYLETSLEPDEVLTEIEVPYLPPCSAAVYKKESVRLGDYAIASIAVMVTVNNKVIQDARVVLGAVGATTLRAMNTEKLLIGRPVDIPFEDAAEAAAREANPKTDVEGSVEYKRHIVKYITREALRQAVKRAQGK